jgi:Domain of unknown function (DUF4398)
VGYARTRRFQLIFALALAGGLAVACATAPVQEMSDARQAIRAARDAGAAQAAPEQLEEARSLLSSAEAHLEQRRFRDARREAIAARASAVAAMEAAHHEPKHEP